MEEERKFGVREALQAKYTGKEWIFMWEVPNGTAWSKERTADAMAVNLWPSRGLEIIGFEIKVARSDWLRELKQPEKAEACARYCDRWYLVVPNEDVAKKEELPKTWGMLTLRGKRLIETPAVKKMKACEVDRSFLAAMLRCAVNQQSINEEHRRAVDIAYQNGKDEAKRSFEHQVTSATSKFNMLEQRVKEFEQKSGIHIDRYGYGELGSTIQMIRDYAPRPHYEDRMLSVMEEAISGAYTRAIGEINALKEALAKIKATKELLNAPETEEFTG